MAKQNIMIFTLGGQPFGLEAMKVESIMRSPTLKTLDASEPNVLGMITVHNREVKLFDSYSILHLPSAGNPLETVVAMNQSDGTTVAIPIDRADGIVDAEDREMNLVPEILSNVPIHYISKIVYHQGKLILMINPDAF